MARRGVVDVLTKQDLPFAISVGCPVGCTLHVGNTLVNQIHCVFPGLLARVIDQTSSGTNNRQSVCREKKDFPVSDCMFQELFMSL